MKSGNLLTKQVAKKILDGRSACELVEDTALLLRQLCPQHEDQVLVEVLIGRAQLRRDVQLQTLTSRECRYVSNADQRSQPLFLYL